MLNPLLAEIDVFVIAVLAIPVSRLDGTQTCTLNGETAEPFSTLTGPALVTLLWG